MDKKNTFHYDYSAERREEIERIRSRYRAPREDRMELLRRLDRCTTRKGMITSVAMGVIGCLLLGIGMCCVMEWAASWFVQGVAIGVIGIVCIAVAYPLYTRITAKERQKAAPQILRLAEELSEEES